MSKKLSAARKDLALVIEHPTVDLVDLTWDIPLEGSGDALTLRPSNLTKKDRVRESTQRMICAHDEMLRRLAG